MVLDLNRKLPHQARILGIHLGPDLLQSYSTTVLQGSILSYHPRPVVHNDGCTSVPVQ